MRRSTLLVAALGSAAALLAGARVSPAADPVPASASLPFSTYLGGESSDVPDAAAFGPDGALWIAGTSYSRDLRGAARSAKDAGTGDVVVLRLDPATHAVLSAAWIGGSGYDSAAALAFGEDGAAFVVGQVDYGGFPATAPWSAPQRRFEGRQAFLARVSPDGWRFTWSAVLDETRFARAAGLAVTPEGDPVVVGRGSDGSFVARFDADGSGVVFTRRVAAGGWVSAVAVEPDGRILVAGTAPPQALTDATRLLAPALDGTEGYLAEIDASGLEVLRVALLGDTDVNAVSASADGPLLFGRTIDASFPATPAPHGAPGPDSSDACLLRLNADWSIAAAALFGGSDDEYYLSMAPAADGRVWVCGSTKSADLPLLGPIQPLLGSSEDAFLAAFDATTLTPSFSTYLGGDARELGYSVVVAPDGAAWFVGATASTDFPTAAAEQVGAPAGGSYDMFVARVDPASAGATPPPPLDVAAQALGARSVRVSWRPGSDDATQFVVFRRDVGGYVRAAVLPADALEWTDAELRPDSSYSYALQAVNAAGGSRASAVVEARTASTLDVRVDFGVVDFRDDSFDGSTRSVLRGRLATNAQSAGGVFDPRREGIEWTASGGQALSSSLAIRAGDRRWRKTRHGLRWARRGTRLDFDPRTGRFELRTGRYGRAPWPDESGLTRLAVAVGDDVGSVEVRWRSAGPWRMLTR
jgi:hypothetical protein